MSLRSLGNPDFPALSYYRPQPFSADAPRLTADVCIYGATSGGVMAAIHASRRGRSVILAAFGAHVGGLTSGGLGATDIGNKDAIGGISREFYQRLGKHYGKSESWTFEPSVAEKLFLEMLAEEGIEVRYEQHLTEVRKEGSRITEITMESGECYQAEMFIDATYEGDLLARAGVSFHVGRESNACYNEIFNGVHIGHPNHQFRRFVDPYRVPGVPESGLLPGISDEIPEPQGTGDHRIQAYNFRICLTNREENRRPIPCPTGYNPDRYTLLARYLETGVWDVMGLSIAMPNDKTDTNNYGAFATDHIGANYDWPEGDYARRQEIFQDHVTYMQGLLWFLTHDSRVPEAIREEMSEWGLPKDEFPETGGWSHELYVREARRMISDYVMTEHDCVGSSRAEDPVGLAAYTMDSHNCARVVLGGRAFNEGNVEMGGFTPYPISYRALVPKESECSNLLVPWALSASHIAFGSIRMEPVFMVLGQSVAEAAHLAIRSKCSVQQVSYEALQTELLAVGQVLKWPVRPSILEKTPLGQLSEICN
jgi:FAD dependent oxidoreductase